MITDILDLEDGATLRGAVTVIGSGIAGTEAALYLSRRGVDTILIESGREAFDPAIQALNDVTFAAKAHRPMDPEGGYHGYLPEELRGASRLRQWGGTSNIWTGKWKYFEPGDFGPRPWMPDADWPVRYDDLLPHYRSAAGELGFDDLEAEPRRPQMRAVRDHLGRAGLKTSSFWWEAEPTRTRVRFGQEMRASESLRVVLGATATELLADPSGRRIEAVQCRSLEGRSLRVAAECVVVATGALETPRLMLASTGASPAGIGNARDLVGRYYADHPKYRHGAVRPGAFARANATELQHSPKPRFCPIFSLDDATQAAHRLVDHGIYLKPVYASRRETLRRWLGGAAPHQDDKGRVSAYRATFVLEQVPNPESRVRLGTGRDALGMPELVVDWRFTEQDRRSVATIAELMAERFADAGLGELTFEAGPPDLDGNMTDAAHQIGTTRMSESPATGVVDRDCRVFGTDNLYVAGSAVFPSCPAYSLTFTILALARRMSAKVLEEVRVPA